MYLRLFQVKVQADGLELARDYYQSTFIPRLKTMKGCLFARLMQNRADPSELISMTLWKTREDAEAYHNSPVFQQIMAEVSAVLAESSVWKIRLSRDLELEYQAETEEPVIRSFPISSQAELKSPEIRESTPRYIRMFAHKVEKGKMEEFKRLYRKEIIPALEKIPGCIYAYMCENLQGGDEIISFTIWKSRQAEEDYEKSGQFHALVDKVKHTYSQLLQWKMSLAREPGVQARTSDDLKIDRYQVVSGEEFS